MARKAATSSAGGRRLEPKLSTSVTMPRCSKACLLKFSGESQAAMLAGMTRMKKVIHRPPFERARGWVQEASAQQSGGVSREAMKSANAARADPAMATPGRNEGCKNALTRPVRKVPRRTALQTASEKEGSQRVNRAFIGVNAMG